MDRIIKEKFKLPISEMVGVPSEIELNVVEDDEVDKIKKGEENMIRIDYEGAWKELKEHLRKKHITDETVMEVVESIEQKHTHNYVDIKKRIDKEVADYCLKKYSEVYMENIYLKEELKGQRKEIK